MVALAMAAEESAFARKTRERILAAAERRFKYYGYAKSTVVDIAADCAMSNANVYRFYRSKADLVDAITARLVVRCERFCREVATRPSSAQTRVVEFMVELYRWRRREYQRNPRMHELLAMATDEGRGFITSHLNVIADLLAGIIVDGVNEGEFVVKDPSRLARIIQDATVKFIDPRLVAWYSGEDLEARVRDVMTTIVRGLSISAPEVN